MRQASNEGGEALALAERLRARRAEIEEAALLRVRSLADPPQLSEAQYAQGLQRAVTAALDYGIEGIEKGGSQTPNPPPELISQARLAARNQVGLDVVMRRYVAGQALLGDFLVSEATEFSPAEPKRSLRRLSALLDRLLIAVSAAYEEEQEFRQRGQERQRAERIERLLAGELLETADLAYDFAVHHLGVLVQGAGARELLEALADGLDAILLAVRRERSLVWAWLGSRRALDPAEAVKQAAEIAPEGLHLALGEPGEGIAGWRLSHRQADAALAVARRGEAPVVRYADVALIASALHDDLLVTSLRKLYLEPLEAERDGGEVLRETLRAYFGAGRNAASAAAVLGVSRQAVNGRLQAVEQSLGQSLRDCAGCSELALRLEPLTNSNR